MNAPALDRLLTDLDDAYIGLTGGGDGSDGQVGSCGHGPDGGPPTSIHEPSSATPFGTLDHGFGN